MNRHSTQLAEALGPGVPSGATNRSAAKSLAREEARAAGNAGRPARRIRRVAWLVIAAQVAFVFSMLIAAAWQGPHYSLISDSMSDMYAVTAPDALFLVVVLTLCGAATMWFAWRGLRPALAPAGRRLATVTSALLALSIFGIGDLLTPASRLDCRLADPGCTPAMQLSNLGGKMDDGFSTVGVILLIAFGFVLAYALKRIPAWRSWVRPVRWFSVMMTALLILDGVTQGANGLSGMFERFIALTGAAGIALLAAGAARRSRTAELTEVTPPR